MSDSWQITACVRLEGKIEAKDRETAMAEAESIVRGAFKNLKWLNLIEPKITATRRIFG
jgi:hypothetical protein